MANKDDYLTEYRQFFEEFADTVEPNDQLPVKLGSYKFINSEVVGGIVDWCLQYLNRKSCPSTLIGPLTKQTIDEIRIACKKQPLACGFNPNENVYEPLKLMQTVMSKMNEICLRYLDNSQLDNLPAPPTVPPPMVSMCATRNTRRRMEDRHIVIHDVNSMFNIQDSSPTSYYAIFDGHAGPDAASYSAAHLHQFLFESDFYPSDPEQALKEAFLRTDEFFLEKSKIENFRSGTTAVCALLRPKEETLYVAWVGDSQALLVNRGKVLQIVKPHKPCRQDEKDRIEANGGCVMFWGMWRVNGQLAVSRAIGDIKLKPYVTAEPDVVAVPLDGNEEFLIMACDGLWDFVSEDDAAIAVYNRIKANPENVEDIAEHLADIAKQEGSRDNISVIVIFLKDPSKIAKKLSTEWGWTEKEITADAAMDTSVDNTNNTANITTNNTIDLFDVFQKPVAKPEFKSNGTTDNNETDLYFFDKPTNGKRPADFDEEDEDFGPETDVDAVDDVLLSPTIAAAKALVEGNMNQNAVDDVDKMDIIDVDMELQRQQTSDFEPVRGCREETPTPPADSVLDSSGLADNVAESGEDSEDEWNYYRVDPKQKENNANSLETNTKVSSENPFDIDESDEMSQLNPDAKEFVPVSPTRNNAVSPVLNFSRDVVDDTLVARSPRRAVPMDNYVPSPEEFCRGIKQRPSELFEELEKDAENNENQNQNGHQLSHQEIMQNLLNGKDPSEIEFHPSNLNNLICKDNKENETPEQHDAVEAAAVVAATEADATDFAAFVPRSQDPMSMSFYEDKNEEGTEFSTNPFNEDLNKVHVLPDFIEDITPKQSEESGVCELPKSPEQLPTEAEAPKHDQQEQEDVCSLPKSPIVDMASPVQNVCEYPLQSPPARSETPKSPLSNDVCEIPKSPVHIDVCEISKSPMLDTHSPMELSSPAGPLSPKSPIPELTGLVSPDITASIKDENVSAEISETTKSPLISQTPIEDLEQQVQKTPEITNIDEIKSPLPTDSNPIEEVIASNLIEDHATSKMEEIVCELNKQASDVQELITDAIQDIITSDKPSEEPHFEENIELSEEAKYLSQNITNIANEINEITDEVNIPDNNFMNNVEDKLVENANTLIDYTASTTAALNDFIQETEAKSPELKDISIVESEVAPSEIMNSFLDRSVIPEVTSPLSSPEKFEQERPELWKCEFPLPSQHDITCETIQPEYPVHTIASPSEESKGNDTPPTTPAHVIDEPELKRGSPEPQKIVEAVEKLSEPPIVETKESIVPAVVAVAAATATAAVVSKAKPKVGPISAAATKKTPSKTSPTSPSKTLASKTATTTKRTTTTAAPKLSTTTTTTAAKLAAAKPKTTTTTPTPSPKPISRATAAAPKPRTPTSTSTASKTAAEKKPLTNGDAKAPIRHTLVKKTTTSTVGAKPAANSTTAASKVSLTKTSTNTTARPLANGTSKPALSATRTTARPAVTSSAAPKPRPASLTSKSTTTTSAAKAAPIKSSSTTATKSLGTTTAKPKPTSTLAPRPRMVLTAKTAVKTADTEKQIKETANKQISASRTSTTRTSSTTTRTSTTTLKKAAPLSNRTSSTHTRTTTVKSSATGKKPTEVTRTTITKTKSSPIKPPVEQNGVVNVIQEITTVSVVSENDDSQLQLVKDNSPVDAIPSSLVDNSQLPPPMEIIAD